MGKIFEAMEKFRKQNGKREHSEIICSVKDKKENKTEKEPHNKEDIKETDISPKIKKKHEKEFLRAVENIPSTVLDPSIVAYLKPHSQEAEQFRLLKTSILFPDGGDSPRTILVTSAAPGEGKSFIAANLAACMAMSIDEYVLLIDCDLRRPSVHKLFGFPDDTPGLTEYLTKDAPLSGLLQKTEVNKLTLLLCGIPPLNPYELVSSEQMRKLIREVKSRYSDRYIIIDSPPPYITAETNALAKLVDAIIIVVKTGETKKEAVQDLVDTYGKKKILGVVKNFAEKSLGHHYKYAYGYGYNYKKKHENG